MVQNMEINVSSLTDSEQDFILEVLQRDEKLRRLEEQRVKRLKAELLEVRRKGAKRGSGKYSERSCGRCQEPMGLLIRGGSQCRACKHHVCRKCQSVRSNGSWVCTVCAKEIDLKMSTGDWFYDERVNRFSTAPGHNLVRVSLRKKSPFKRRETAGELLLNKTALNSHQAVPMPKPRLKDITQTNKSSPPEVNEGLDVREQQRSDTESAEKSSLSSSHTESSRSTPLMQRKEVTAQISPAGSTVSRLTVPTNTNSISSSTSVTEAASLIHHMNVCSDSLRDVDGIFKKSIRKVHKLSDIKPASTLDLRKDGTESTVSSLRDRCKSVPGLNAYSINRTQLPTRTLQLSVWHYDRFGRNVFLGEVEVPMDDHDIDSAHEECMALRRKAATPSALSPFNQYKGELVVLLKYVTANNLENAKGKGKKARPEDGAELHVLIKEAKNLTAMKAGGVSDSFVKGYLLPSKNKASFKRKTQVVKKTLNPHYDHTFIYKELSLEQLKDMCLELTVWDRETLSSNDFLGGVRLGLGAVTLKEEKEEWVADSTGEEISLWQKMMQYPDSWAEGTLLLRSSMRRGK
ncbi:synaptotagmin-like protein 4 isoform X2 [Myxocyprinus asiaticus]|uniref:synaptotagmin-like protein 4 isoform X2 n=1 Tax=Myxocyprinus asiaticus TaxID=70543 RepID=UPI002223204B|nr:synaptotagmin-like protein 4 isoform X2 [Myxocyprinus asiaticus]